METIALAKKNLEKKIIALPEVIGIGVVLLQGDQFIEIAVKNSDALAEMAKMFPQSKWEGHPVKIVIREQTII